LIRIGSRGSQLARWQAEHIATRLHALGHATAI
jgi:porphobilinogen deaminase